MDPRRLTRKERRHTCHWPGCEKLVDPALWGCKPHWMSVPRRLRERLWKAYRPGQEIYKNPSPEYVAAALAIREWIFAYQASTRGMSRAKQCANASS